MNLQKRCIKSSITSNSRLEGFLYNAKIHLPKKWAKNPLFSRRTFTVKKPRRHEWVLKKYRNIEKTKTKQVLRYFQLDHIAKFGGLNLNRSLKSRGLQHSFFFFAKFISNLHLSVLANISVTSSLTWGDTSSYFKLTYCTPVAFLSLYYSEFRNLILFSQTTNFNLLGDLSGLHLSVQCNFKLFKGQVHFNHCSTTKWNLLGVSIKGLSLTKPVSVTRNNVRDLYYPQRHVRRLRFYRERFNSFDFFNIFLFNFKHFKSKTRRSAKKSRLFFNILDSQNLDLYFLILFRLLNYPADVWRLLTYLLGTFTAPTFGIDWFFTNIALISFPSSARDLLKSAYPYYRVTPILFSFLDSLFLDILESLLSFFLFFEFNCINLIHSSVTPIVRYKYIWFSRTFYAVRKFTRTKLPGFYQQPFNSRTNISIRGRTLLDSICANYYNFICKRTVRFTPVKLFERRLFDFSSVYILLLTIGSFDNASQAIVCGKLKALFWCNGAGNSSTHRGYSFLQPNANFRSLDLTSVISEEPPSFQLPVDPSAKPLYFALRKKPSATSLIKLPSKLTLFKLSKLRGRSNIAGISIKLQLAAPLFKVLLFVRYLLLNVFAKPFDYYTKFLFTWTLFSRYFLNFAIYCTDCIEFFNFSTIQYRFLSWFTEISVITSILENLTLQSLVSLRSALHTLEYGGVNSLSYIFSNNYTAKFSLLTLNFRLPVGELAKNLPYNYCYNNNYRVGFLLLFLILILFRLITSHFLLFLSLIGSWPVYFFLNLRFLPNLLKNITNYFYLLIVSTDRVFINNYSLLRFLPICRNFFCLAGLAGCLFVKFSYYSFFSNSSRWWWVKLLFRYLFLVFFILFFFKILGFFVQITSMFVFTTLFITIYINIMYWRQLIISSFLKAQTSYGLYSLFFFNFFTEICRLTLTAYASRWGLVCNFLALQLFLRLPLCRTSILSFGYNLSNFNFNYFAPLGWLICSINHLAWHFFGVLRIWYNNRLVLLSSFFCISDFIWSYRISISLLSGSKGWWLTYNRQVDLASTNLRWNNKFSTLYLANLVSTSTYYSFFPLVFSRFRFFNFLVIELVLARFAFYLMTFSLLNFNGSGLKSHAISIKFAQFNDLFKFLCWRAEFRYRRFPLQFFEFLKINRPKSPQQRYYRYSLLLPVVVFLLFIFCFFI